MTRLDREVNRNCSRLARVDSLLAVIAASARTPRVSRGDVHVCGVGNRSSFGCGVQRTSTRISIGAARMPAPRVLVITQITCRAPIVNSSSPSRRRRRPFSLRPVGRSSTTVMSPTVGASPVLTTLRR